MSLLFFLGGRHNLKAWGKTMAEAGCSLKGKPDAKVYARATEQLIRNDCEIIEECAHILTKSPDVELRNQKRLVMFSRYNHLLKLEPYADKTQKAQIHAVKEKVTKARKYR